MLICQINGVTSPSKGNLSSLLYGINLTEISVWTTFEAVNGKESLFIRIKIFLKFSTE